MAIEISPEDEAILAEDQAMIDAVLADMAARYAARPQWGSWRMSKEMEHLLSRHAWECDAETRERLAAAIAEAGR